MSDRTNERGAPVGSVTQGKAMIRSMTGFGEAQRESPAGVVRVQVKTVNHRFLNTTIKTPTGFERYEREMTEALKRHLVRGHATVSLSIVAAAGSAEDSGLEFDVEKARRYQAALVALQERLDIPGPVDLPLLMRFSDAFQGAAPDRAAMVDPELLIALTDEAAAAARVTRESEGARLTRDLEARLAAIEGWLERVERRGPERLVSERDRMRAAIVELSGQVEVDEDRLAREVAYLAERWDINEEVVRFRAHVEAFGETLRGGAPEGVGKRLGFLVQEMHREANTIGSKANDAEISHASVGLKEEIERLREQVENIE